MRNRVIGACVVATGVVVGASAGGAQELDRVLAFRAVGVDGQTLVFDRGAAGAWQRLQKLATTASVLHTVAHPDDEHVGMLTRLGRGEGVRTALLTLNRGEGGANAAGAELFDALGLIRAEELRLAGTYYGLDDQYFTTAADYGFSKTFQEAERSWDVERVLEDMVRIIRLNRPLVVISRFHGSGRDGHGHHQAAGRFTPLAVAAAADPDRFPAQIRLEGLRPWRVRRLFRGGVRDGEQQDAAVAASVYSPWLGDTYESVGRLGVSLQRSQTSGRLRSGGGPAVYRYERLLPAEGQGDEGLFGGLPTRWTEMFELTGEAPPPRAVELLRVIESSIDEATGAFSFIDPAGAGVIGPLATALNAVRSLLPLLASAPDTRFLLQIKERQIQDAVAAALGVALEALATNVADDSPAETVSPVQALAVRLEIRSPTDRRIEIDSAAVESGPGWVAALRSGFTGPMAGGVRSGVVSVQVGNDATGGPYLGRQSIAENQYTVLDSADLHLASRRPAMTGSVWFIVDRARIRLSTAVRARVPNFPDGYRYPEVAVLPPVSVAMESDLFLTREPGPQTVSVPVLIRSQSGRRTRGTARLSVPAGWGVRPADAGFDLPAGAGDARLVFEVTTDDRTAAGRVTASATVDGRMYRDGVETIDRVDLERRQLFHRAAALVRFAGVEMPPGLQTVGYVMGAGDAVPLAIERLGISVRLLERADLESGDLGVFDAIMVGTRAYAVREDLVRFNHRLLEYAERGGNLVVLYQTQEFVPNLMAPFPAALPGSAEEVSEEDSPVRLIASGHPVLTTPNALTAADFDDWIEQRGSKFFTAWSDTYTPLIETHDTGQDPQEGIWLTAPFGAGHYTYLALALHRQLPYGVVGAFRILANVLGTGR